MGKPLIGDVQMLAIHEGMLRLRALDRELRGDVQGVASRARREPDVALLAATLLQLRPGDLLVADGDAALAEAVISMAQESTFTPEHRAALLTCAGESAAPVAAGHALAQARTGRPGDDAPVTVCLLAGAAHDLFHEAMRLASEQVLPLVLVVLDGMAARAQRLQSIENVEVVRVDATDAVACCRVMQESLLRARNRWGCVVLHAVHLPGAVDAVVAFEAHLRRRGLQF